MTESKPEYKVSKTCADNHARKQLLESIDQLAEPHLLTQKQAYEIMQGALSFPAIRELLDGYFASVSVLYKRESHVDD